jgi:hypothetical protein
MRWREIKLREYSADLLVVLAVTTEVGVLWLAFFSENPRLIYHPNAAGD